MEWHSFSMDNYNFENIPLWDSNALNFDILSDEVNGRIPVARLERWQDFAELLETPFFNRPNTQLVFRGHRRFDWGLMPTLARIPESGIIDRSLAESQLEYFRRAVRGRLPDNSLVLKDEEDELWAVGQHHGLLTPLLDWTYSPYVALFFAFSKEDSEEEKENPYRTVYVLNKSFVANDNICPDIRIFEPSKDDHGRLVNQAGLFTFSPYDSTIENKLTDTLSNEDFEDDALRNAAEDEQANIIAKYICKIYIKNEDREGCMRHLRRMNVHHASLFPDLIGASEYCNVIIAEERARYELEKSEERYENTSIVNSDAHTPSRVFVADSSEITMLSALLDSLADQSVDKGCIQLVAEKISSTLNDLKTVDWYQRETIQSQMRAKARIILRKYGYPPQLRDLAIDNVLGYLIQDAKTASTVD